MPMIHTLPAARAVSADDGLRVELSSGATDLLLDEAQARALAAQLSEAADRIATPGVVSHG